jgi:hypothetical protein
VFRNFILDIRIAGESHRQATFRNLVVPASQTLQLPANIIRSLFSILKQSDFGGQEIVVHAHVLTLFLVEPRAVCASDAATHIVMQPPPPVCVETDKVLERPLLLRKDLLDLFGVTAQEEEAFSILVINVNRSPGPGRESRICTHNNSTLEISTREH